MPEAIKYQDCPHAIDHTPSAAASGGEVVQLGDGRAAVLPVDLASGGLGAACAAGIWTVAKRSAEVWLKGDPIFWDHSANEATCVPRMGAGDRDFFLGTACADVATGVATGKVNLNVEPRWAIDLARDPFATVVVKTVVGSTTVEVPHVEPRGGGTTMILGTTAEAQKVDLLSERSFAVASNWIAEGEVNIVTNGDASALDFNIGVASGTHATDFDAIAEFVSLQVDGNSANINAQSDDGTTDVAPVDTTLDFTAGTPFSFKIDGRDPSSVKVYIDGVRVNSATTFTLAAAAGPLKLIAHVEKTSDDSPGTFQINRLRVRTMQED